MGLVLKEECFKIIGACMEVHKQLGPGLLESVYQEALAMEFTEQGIPFEEQCSISIFYKGKLMNKKFRPDFLCYDKIILEIKAINRLTLDDDSQIINAIKITRSPLGLLVNFGEPSLKQKRFVNSVSLDRDTWNNNLQP